MWAPQWVSDDVGGLPVLARSGRPGRRRRLGRRTQAPGRGPGGGPHAGARARAADEDRRRRPRRGDEPHHDLLHRPAPRRLPRPGARPRRHAARPGRAAAAVGARRGQADRRHRVVRPRAVLLDVPRRLRAGQSVRMAKDQDLPLNPLRISGACGKLMCCLKYEHPLYQDFAAKAPAVGEDGRHRRRPGHGRRPRRPGREGRGADGRRRAAQPVRARVGVRQPQGLRHEVGHRLRRAVAVRGVPLPAGDEHLAQHGPDGR